MRKYSDYLQYAYLHNRILFIRPIFFPQATNQKRADLVKVLGAPPFFSFFLSNESSFFVIY